MRRHKHAGSSLDEFLAEDGTLAEAEAAALKRVIAWQVARGMDRQRISKSDMARAMRTSRAALDRLLDPKNESVSYAPWPVPRKSLASSCSWKLAWIAARSRPNVILSNRNAFAKNLDEILRRNIPDASG